MGLLSTNWHLAHGQMGLLEEALALADEAFAFVGEQEMGWRDPRQLLSGVGRGKRGADEAAHWSLVQTGRQMKTIAERTNSDEI